MSLLVLFVSSALAFESEAQPVLLQDSANLFDSIAYSTGPLPDGSPVAVQFSIETDGGAGVSMEGEGNLSWPDALSLAFDPTVDSGIFNLDVDLAAVTLVIVDLSDYGYYGEFEIDRRDIRFDGMSGFSPWLLPGANPSRAEIVDTTDSAQLIYYSYEIWAGISLNFEADMSPTVVAGFSGVQWGLNDEATIIAEDQPVELTPEQVASYDLATIFRGAWDATLSIVFTPTISVSAPFIPDIEIASFDIPIDLATEAFEQDFPETSYSFPLPWLQTSVSSGDFGDVDVDEIANLEIPIDNLGDLLLQGTARIEGSADFSVYPETFGALPGDSDGLVVTYAPTVVGEGVATLILESNDPTAPTLEIPLLGNGTEQSEEDVGGYTDDEKVGASTSACGCASTPASGAAPLIGLAAALLIARRRR